MRSIQQRVRSTFRYENGILYWVDPPYSKRRSWLIGRAAGCKAKNRWSIKFEGRLWPRHHLIWIYFKGPVPKSVDIDHRDRNSVNDKIRNLRIASHQQNLVNCKLYRNNTSGFRGIYFSKNKKKWIAELNSGYIGRFESPAEAATAVETAGKKIHGKFWSGSVGIQ